MVGPNCSKLLITVNSTSKLVNNISKIIVFIIIWFSLGKGFSWGIAFCLPTTEIMVITLKAIQIHLRFKTLPLNKEEGFFKT